LKTISDATEDIDVTLLFNNAGFMVTGFFDKTCARSCPGPRRLATVCTG
jgi:hypothetical protein